ncbi:MAG TPA: helix-turn-helix transcriptional regulator [Chlorobiota bacterium]|nr:helix-turn-helix transcriptional regulator [Chlorobiota bacterium]
MTFGELLQWFRGEHNLSQIELAARLHISQSFLSQLERDERSPGKQVVSIVAAQLQVPDIVILVLTSRHSEDMMIEASDFSRLKSSMVRLIKEHFPNVSEVADKS